jgi:hypothetical protein
VAGSASKFAAPAGSLSWVVLPESKSVVDPGDQPELESVLHSGQLKQIYTMGRRSVYRGSLSDGREIAVKEVCYRGLVRQFKLRHLREPKVLHEFRSGCEYLSKGGKTPRFLGMVVEQNALLLKRGFIFLEWLDNAVTLTEHLKSQDCCVADGLWRDLANSLVVSAQTGLVHGGHSPENVMVVSGEDEPLSRFQIIDFADSQLHEAFHDEGFANDIARIGARMVTEGACSQEQTAGFINATAETAWPDSALRSNWLQYIRHGVAAILSGEKKM